MILIPRRSYGPDLFDEFSNDPLFTDSTEKNNDSRKFPVMRTGITEKDGNYIMEVELPGLRKEDIKAELKGRYLTISARHDVSNESKNDKETVIHRERYTSFCKRTFFVGEHTRQGDIEAGFESGILKLQVLKNAPKVEGTPKYIDML